MTDEELIATYRRQHPASELNDTQILCIRPLLAVNRLHNWRHSLSGWTRPDGGFRACGPDGIVVLIKHGRLSTYDDSSLTLLVLAAHEHHCRIDIGTAGFGMLRIQVNQRTEAGNLYARHPGLDQLWTMVDKRRGAR